jgi:hypothetical protein
MIASSIAPEFGSGTQKEVRGERKGNLEPERSLA